MYRWAFLLLMITSTVLFQNCSARHESVGSNVLGSGAELNMALSLEAYESTLYPLISASNSCAACHGVSQQPLHAIPDPALAHDITTSFALVNLRQPAESRLVQKIRGGHQGFPASLADEMETAIQAWADLYVSLGGDLGVPEGELGASFQSIKEFILDSQCVACHSPTGVHPSIDYTDYVTTLNTGGVVPGNAAASPLYQSCQDGSMPQGGPALSAEQITALQDWINNGALNN